MDKRMAGDYEIIQSFHIGDQEVVLGENVKAPPEERYMCAYCQQNEIVALYNYFWGHYTNNRYDALKDLCQRAEREIDYLAAIGEIPPITSQKEQERER